MLTPPHTPTGSAQDTLHGITIPDPYRWLEDGESEETRKWTYSQNEYLSRHLKNDRFKKFSDELTRDFAFTNFSNPYPVKGTYFWTERKPGEQQSSLYMKKGLEDSPRKLIDPNSLRPGSTSSLDVWVPSPKLSYLVYGLSEGGGEMSTLHIIDLATGKELQDTIPQCRYPEIAWLADESGFFYDRHPDKGSVPPLEEHLWGKIYFHKIGDDSKNDICIFGEGRNKDDMFALAISHDRTQLVISATQNWTENQLYLYDIPSKKTTTLVEGIPAKFYFSFLENSAVIHTNLKADNYRVLLAPLSEITKPLSEWQEIIPEKDHLLQNITPTKDFLVLEYLKNASSEVLLTTHAGEQVETVPIPAHSSIAGISARLEEEEFFFGVDSFTFPKISYRYSPAEKTVTEFRKTENPINPNEYAVAQEWYTSKDGTPVPLFIYHKKDLGPGPHPTILYGYGGFSVTNSPSFMRTFVPWVSRGGVFALANIRGGGEFGESWHTQGTKEKKQNCFDDFIAAGEFLIRQQITDSAHLGILGGSNGGLLVAAALTQRPELFKAACSKVPLTDMVRFPKFGMAIRWIHEYGNPDIETDLKNILRWSPYHNTQEHTEYPATLFTTALHDTRVDPLHARKMAARLQAINAHNPILLFTEEDAGHGPGKPVSKIVEGQALTLAFFAEHLALNI